MSRSYKKFPHFTDYCRDYTPFAKRQANKTVRAREREMLHEYIDGNVERAEALEIDDGSDYKEVFNQYDIHDFVFTVYSPTFAKNIKEDYLRKGLLK